MTSALGPAVAPRAGDVRVADPDRRFYAFAIDRLIAWGIDVAVAVVASRFLMSRGHVVARRPRDRRHRAGGRAASSRCCSVPPAPRPGKALLGLRAGSHRHRRADRCRPGGAAHVRARARDASRSASVSRRSPGPRSPTPPGCGGAGTTTWSRRSCSTPARCPWSTRPRTPAPVTSSTSPRCAWPRRGVRREPLEPDLRAGPRAGRPRHAGAHPDDAGRADHRPRSRPRPLRRARADRAGRCCRPRPGASPSTPASGSSSTPSCSSAVAPRPARASRARAWSRCRRPTCRSPRPMPRSSSPTTAPWWSPTAARPTARPWSARGCRDRSPPAARRRCSTATRSTSATGR